MSEQKAGKEKKGNGLKILIIVLLVLLLVGGTAFGVYYVMSKNNHTSNKAEAANVIEEQTYPLDDFLVNLADEDTRKFLKVKIFIGYEKNKKLAGELELKKPIIRDAINSVLRSKLAKDFSSKGTEDIKKELLNRINPLLKEGKPINIYFYEIIIQ